MKAIYINLDPYVRAARAYVAGETDTPPRIVPLALPLSVVVPAGEDAALLCQTEATAASGTQPLPFATWSVSPSLGDPVRTGLSPHLSEEFVAETAAAYAIPHDAASVVATVTLTDGAAENPRTVVLPPITVLVRRERAQSPVDLVDIAPPAAAPTAAQINTALGGSGAAEGAPLAGVWLRSAILNTSKGSGPATLVVSFDGDRRDLQYYEPTAPNEPLPLYAGDTSSFS